MPERRHKLGFRRQAQSERRTNEEEVMEPSSEVNVDVGNAEDAVEFGNDESGNEEETVEFDDSVSVEGDDSEAICEDTAGYTEKEPDLDGDLEHRIVEVDICENMEEHFGEAAREDGDEYDDDSGDDIWNDDNIPDPLSNSNDEVEEVTFTSGIGPDDLITLGKTFSSANDLKSAFLSYSLKSQYDIKMYKSSHDRLGAKCTKCIEENCPWKVYGSFERPKNKIMIKVCINEHTCVRSGYTKLLKSGSISELFEERLRVDPKIKAQHMVDEIKREYNMIVSVHQCRRAKRLAAKRRRESHEAQFARVWDYQAELFRTNPGSTVEIETLPGPVPGSKARFYRMYVCLEVLKESWKMSCRPIIGLDAAFMKWDMKGQMLAAVGRDGDNRIFPIAWAIVEVEDIPNWLWFVQLLKKDLRLDDGEYISIISDKQKGLLNAVHNELPKAEHRMCARHILENWKKTNKDIELERLFWKIARSYTKNEHTDNMAAMKKYNQGAYDSLLLTAPTAWSRAYFKLGSLCNDNLNNLSESFNRNVRESRRLPILDALENVRRKCMERNARRTVLTNRWRKKFTPRADREIESNRQKAKDCIRYMTTGNTHEIEYHGQAYSVDMEYRSCGCGYWQLNGIPCMHAMCVITTTRLALDEYVSDFYLSSWWRSLYAKGIRPVQGSKEWPRLGRLPILPPPPRFGKGRPNNHARRKGPHESKSNKNKLTRHGRVVKCSNCNKEGHNKSRCPNATAPPPPKRPRGRPRKYQGESSEAGSSQHGSQSGSQAAPQGRFGFST